MASPANMLPPEYDDVQPTSYDPEYTADISTKMRVPHTIGVGEGEANPQAHATKQQAKLEQERHLDQKRSAAMHVPDKIVVVGQEQSLGLKSDLRLNFDSSPLHEMAAQNYVSLRTPPRVLTLDEQPFPLLPAEKSEEEMGQEAHARKPPSVSFQNGYIAVTPTRFQKDRLESEVLDSSALMIQDDEDDDDLKKLQKKIAKLSLHVLRLQEDNTQRSRREVIFYPFMIGYVVFQVFRWFLRKDY